MMYKVNEFIKYKVASYFLDLKRLFKISAIYSVFIVGLTCIFSIENRLIVRLMIGLGYVAEFYVTWGISSVIAMSFYVERDEPILKNNVFLRPGRYFRIGKNGYGRYIELRTSPVDDLCYILLFLGVFILPMCLLQIILTKDLSSLLFINVIVAIHLSLLKEINRLEKDYVLNMEKARVIFFEKNGDMKVLKEHEEYQRYQVSLEYEEKWMNELKESQISQE